MCVYSIICNGGDVWLIPDRLSILVEAEASFVNTQVTTDKIQELIWMGRDWWHRWKASSPLLRHRADRRDAADVQTNSGCLLFEMNRPGNWSFGAVQYLPCITSKSFQTVIKKKGKRGRGPCIRFRSYLLCRTDRLLLYISCISFATNWNI